MTAQTDDIDRRARRVTAAAYDIDVALMRRPGALAPGEDRDAIDMLNDVARTTLPFAPAELQIRHAETFLALWQSVLTDEADMLWPDPDDTEGR